VKIVEEEKRMNSAKEKVREHYQGFYPGMHVLVTGVMPLVPEIAWRREENRVKGRSDGVPTPHHLWRVFFLIGIGSEWIGEGKAEVACWYAKTKSTFPPGVLQSVGEDEFFTRDEKMSIQKTSVTHSW
jgi:hypothetical protein